MAQQPIRTGIVGASVGRGWGWRSHVPALMALDDFELTAICTAHQETAAEAAAQTGARLTFTDYRDLVASPDIDLVSIAVRVPWHREMVLAAIEAGKHVYCEWPLALNLAEVEEMAFAAKKAGVLAMAGLQARSAPSILYLKELVEQGYAGRPLTATARFSSGHNYMRPGLSWAARRSNGNHLLSIQTAHMLDMVSFCLGGFREISASITTTRSQWPGTEGSPPIDVDAPDCILVQARANAGALVSGHFAFVPAHGSGWRFEIFGEEGTLVGTSPGQAMIMPNRIQGGVAADRELQELAVPDRLVRAPVELASSSAFHVAHNYLRLAEAIRGGGALEPSFDTGLDVFRLLDAMERSNAEGGRWLAL